MTFDDELQRAFATLADRLRDEITRELTTTAAVLGASASDTANRPNDPMIVLLGQIAALDRAGSLSETLDTLTTAASTHAGRVALVLAQPARWRGWRFAGFGERVDGATPLEIADADAGLIAEAARRGASTVLREGGTPAPAFAGRPVHAAACPLPLDGETVAVLYADDGPAGTSPGGAGVAEAPLEILCRHAARKIEALTAFMAARHLVKETDAEPSRTPTAPAPAVPEPDEDEAAARRYARLLVSEIRLYHERDVVEGRRERDLLSRLGGEIARARVMYEERVPASVRRRADYFQAELVSTLAGGDATLVEAGGPHDNTELSVG